ncbi:hypothetical protein BDZ85DRAFT_292501 [Elsinoe ampelina]|uniref:WW domain-containing protein n=1 Tax=Elsinoe ampelina TaxID=302913 RepID=A0A6A6GPN5_9PEZI|nr:hypothetical protein BDZ85DRAFT_292501 [Elsinoe ampelina]
MEEPPQKKLKADTPDSSAPLPPGWTEHTAPSGHKYYYNKATKKSTYTRPASEPATSIVATLPPAEAEVVRGLLSRGPYVPTIWPGHQILLPDSYRGPTYPSHTLNNQLDNSFEQSGSWQAQAAQLGSYQQARTPRGPRHQPQDRPKRKDTIPDCGPWILVYTRLGRRFVHNTETKESFWKFPSDVMQAVIKLDQLKLEEKYGSKLDKTAEASVQQQKQTKAEEELDPEELAAHKARETARLAKEQAEDAALVEEVGGEGERIWVPPAQSTATAAGYDSSEYEEVEVTDSEGAPSDAGSPSPGPLEFNEDDIAYQLAQLGEQHGLDPEEYTYPASSDEAYSSDGASGLPLSDEERYTIFSSLLTDHSISPYTPWDTLTLSTPPHPIMDDDRFTILPSSRLRKEAHAKWCKETILLQQQQKAARKSQPHSDDDPKAPFLRFVAEREKEVKKLYWVEFRRKHKREPELKPTTKFGDKEMEKAYREFVACLKKDAGAREEELGKIVAGMAGGGDVGVALTGRAEYWAVPAGRREGVVAAALAGTGEGEGRADGGESKAERAMRERVEKAAEEQRVAEKARRFAKGQLRESEREIESAMLSGRRAQVAD